MSLDKLKNYVEDILHMVFESAYITELSEGILDIEKFKYFVYQDILYLKEYSKGWQLLAKQHEEYKDYFLKVSQVMENEIIFLSSKFDFKNEDGEQSPSNLLYTSFLLKTAYEDGLLLSLCAFLSCPYVYYKVGKYLLKIARNDNPYLDWIKYYNDDSLKTLIKEIKTIISKLLSQADDQEQKQFIQYFRKTCQMEYMFFDSAYNFEQWPGKNKINNSTKPPCVLSIAGSDSSGGAGIQADLNTFSSNGVFGTTVIAALTAQNSLGVQGVLRIEPEFIKEQIMSVVQDFELKCIKIGMLFDTDVINMVASCIEDTKSKNMKIIIDPVMISTSGHQLLKNDSIEILCNNLFPLADLITPNIDETLKIMSLIDKDNTLTIIENIDDMIYVAKKLANFYKLKSILIKGGHLNLKQKAVDVLYESGEDKISIFESDYIDSLFNTHGTGCSLSSAIASNLAKGYSLYSSVREAKKYVHKSIIKGFRLGKGIMGTLNHL